MSLFPKAKRGWSVPGSNWRPSACKADVITTTPTDQRRGNGQKYKKKLSRAWFRSTDLWVMGPARFHCATLLTCASNNKNYFDYLSLLDFTHCYYQMIISSRTCVCYKEGQKTKIYARVLQDEHWLRTIHHLFPTKSVNAFVCSQSILLFSIPNPHNPPHWKHSFKTSQLQSYKFSIGDL